MCGAEAVAAAGDDAAAFRLPLARTLGALVNLKFVAGHGAGGAPGRGVQERDGGGCAGHRPARYLEGPSGRMSGMTDLFSLEGKHALVTGGSRGIGYMIAQGLLQAGARVICPSAGGGNHPSPSVRKSRHLGQVPDLMACMGLAYLLHMGRYPTWDVFPLNRGQIGRAHV